jgi:hypothetical protein
MDAAAPPRPKIGFGASSRAADFEPTDRLHQIFIADGFRVPAALPQPIAENVDSTRAHYPGADYRLWDGDALRETIAREFEPAVLEAFDRLQPYAYKADLGRYCLLYLYGGLYVDLGVRCMAPIRPPRGAGIAGFRDFEFVSPSWTAVSTGVLWAKSRRSELRIAIDYVVDNCRTRFYGANSLYPTGPALLGRAMIAAMAEKKQQSDADDQWIGVTRLLTPGRPRERMCYIAPDRTIAALKTKSEGGDLTHLGAVGTNNYVALWRERRVYGED